MTSSTLYKDSSHNNNDDMVNNTTTLERLSELYIDLDEVLSDPKLDNDGKFRAILGGIGQLIMNRRLELGITQTQLGQDIKVNASAMSKIELGRRNLTINTLVKIYLALEEHAANTEHINI